MRLCRLSGSVQEKLVSSLGATVGEDSQTGPHESYS